MDEKMSLSHIAYLRMRIGWLQFYIHVYMPAAWVVISSALWVWYATRIGWVHVKYFKLWRSLP